MADPHRKADQFVGFNPRHDDNLTTRMHGEVAGLPDLHRQRPHAGQGDFHQTLHGRLTHRHRKQPVGQIIAVRGIVLFQKAACLQHLYHAEHFALRPAQALADVAHGERARFRHQKFKHVQPLFERRRPIFGGAAGRGGSERPFRPGIYGLSFLYLCLRNWNLASPIAYATNVAIAANPLLPAQGRFIYKNYLQLKAGQPSPRGISSRAPRMIAFTAKESS